MNFSIDQIEYTSVQSELHGDANINFITGTFDGVGYVFHTVDLPSEILKQYPNQLAFDSIVAGRGFGNPKITIGDYLFDRLPLNYLKITLDDINKVFPNRVKTTGATQMTKAKIQVLQLGGEIGTMHAATKAAFTHRLKMASGLHPALSHVTDIYPLRYMVVKAGDKVVMLESNSGFRTKEFCDNSAIISDFNALAVSLPKPLALVRTGDEKLFVSYGDSTTELTYTDVVTLPDVEASSGHFETTGDLTTFEADTEKHPLTDAIRKQTFVAWDVEAVYTPAGLEGGEEVEPSVVVEHRSPNQELAEALGGTAPEVAMDANLLTGGEVPAGDASTRPSFTVSTVTLQDLQSSMFCQIAENWNELPRCVHRVTGPTVAANTTVYMVLIDRGILAFHLPAQVNPEFNGAMDVVRALLLAKERYREVTAEELVDFNPSLLFTAAAASVAPSRTHTRRNW